MDSGGNVDKVVAIEALTAKYRTVAMAGDGRETILRLLRFR